MARQQRSDTTTMQRRLYWPLKVRLKRSTISAVNYHVFLGSWKAFEPQYFLLALAFSSSLFHALTIQIS
jgi:hypothetical protein